MLLSERLDVDGDKLIHTRSHDFQPALDRAADLRAAGATGFSESWLIGTVPMALVTDWLTEAGVTWDDTEAVNEVLRKKMLSGEFQKLRVHEGSF